MVLQLSPLKGYPSFYFDCEAISPFDKEAEYLFFGGDSVLQIITIENVINDKWMNYKDYLKGIYFIISIINGTKIDKSILSSKTSQKIIYQLLKYQQSKLF